MESGAGRTMAAISNTTRPRVSEYAGGALINNGENDRSSHAALPQTFAHPSTGWPSIWNSNSLGPGFGSTARDSSRHRENGTYMNSTAEPIEGKTGSGSLVASSESDNWNINRTPWREPTASGIPSARSGVSPARKRSIAGAPTSQQFLENSSSSNYFSVRGPSITQGPVAKPTASALDPTSGNFSSMRQAEQLTNGFSGFGGFGQGDASQRPDATVGSWEAGSLHSPTDDRRSVAASEYFGTSSAAPSRSGSLPPSRHGAESLSFAQASDNYSRFVQPSRGPNSTFSQTNGRAYQERSGSIQSDSNHLFGRLSVDQDADSSLTHRPSGSVNGLAQPRSEERRVGKECRN